MQDYEHLTGVGPIFSVMQSSLVQLNLLHGYGTNNSSCSNNVATLHMYIYLSFILLKVWMTKPYVFIVGVLYRTGKILTTPGASIVCGFRIVSSFVICSKGPYHQISNPALYLHVLCCNLPFLWQYILQRKRCFDYSFRMRYVPYRILVEKWYFHLPHLVTVSEVDEMGGKWWSRGGAVSSGMCCSSNSSAPTAAEEAVFKT
jgi:hypothetical protein